MYKYKVYFIEIMNILDFDFTIKQDQFDIVKKILTNDKQRKYLIDGNIGAGKTTLVKLLETSLNSQGIKTKAIFEPVDVWRNVGALQYFYDDIVNHSYEFQTFTFITRIKNVIEDILNNQDAEIYLFERHIWSDRYIFGALLKEQFGDVRFKMYEMWWDMWAYIFPLKATKWILLDTDVITAYKRIAERNREEEKTNISMEYLMKLNIKQHEFYNNLIIKNENVLIIQNVLMSNDFIHNKEYLDNIEQLILK